MDACGVWIPTEVWVITVGNLRDTGKGATLSSIAQTCKFLSHIAQPILYENPTGTIDGSRILFRDRYSTFFRTVATNKELASFVKNIKLRRWPDDGWRGCWQLRQDVARRVGMERGIAQEMETHIADAIEAMDIFLETPHLRYLYPNLRSMQFLPCLLPNLREFSLELNSAFNALHYFAMCTTKSPSIMLPSLERLKISVFELGSGYDIDHVRHLLRQSPSLAYLKLTNCSAFWQPMNPSPADSDLEEFEHLTTLVMDQCSLTSVDFARLFRLCPQLEALFYSSGGDDAIPRGRNDDPEVLPMEVMKILRPAQNKLKRLQLDFRCSTNVLLNRNADRVGLINRLQAFSVLQVAELDGESFLENGADINPEA